MTDLSRDDMAALIQSKLEPQRIRATLAFAGLYQLVHETLKVAVVNMVRDFYCVGFDADGMKYDEVAYAARVRDRSPKNLFKGSLLWLVDAGAITPVQADQLDAIYAHRNELTHELGKYLVDPNFEPDMELFANALDILRAINRFWIQVEMDVGTFDDHGELSVDDVTPGTELLLGLCIDAYVEGLPVVRHDGEPKDDVD